MCSRGSHRDTQTYALQAAQGLNRGLCVRPAIPPALFTIHAQTANTDIRTHGEDAQGSRTQDHAKASPTSFPASIGWLHSR